MLYFKYHVTVDSIMNSDSSLEPGTPDTTTSSEGSNTTTSTLSPCTKEIEALNHEIDQKVDRTEREERDYTAWLHTTAEKVHSLESRLSKLSDGAKKRFRSVTGRISLCSHDRHEAIFCKQQEVKALRRHLADLLVLNGNNEQTLVDDVDAEDWKPNTNRELAAALNPRLVTTTPTADEAWYSEAYPKYEEGRKNGRMSKDVPVACPQLIFTSDSGDGPKEEEWTEEIAYSKYFKLVNHIYDWMDECDEKS
ncbi:hypothetical protein AUEXF2481DRAFT_665965 [Aureobasidium subglaciale EXF-2481]|uniref:Uncharacterized protein n=1 Tax=Aureobasidium subglaciale (strain EXF-2481) TaxID=1043005 RepID=A0A074YJD5_AURSE|nr:uncharacterized protein AUEXF2481DRAFT_665965 [Aureobasidium subglaciale EXF-2481]KAI5194154.1 hypothetical protein E4T38_09689 [Aureobasidium subglaciale]KAI5213576.1 hypothetical protein E4T40_09631 [Aureobasidium subglaciale]KAI5215258.1 hypothetical protein E4T41_09669 [Aureobasidium subglaciale]KAI5253244.1 hypothetical protein E4T46_09646 [Aureobasidium subglaciale]KEQ96154.1 hypothetical protein AUEXF2481DRAFT_665965 [Aureobasidium subglaciale EXF-2481]